MTDGAELYALRIAREKIDEFYEDIAAVIRDAAKERGVSHILQTIEVTVKLAPGYTDSNLKNKAVLLMGPGLWS